ncbi:hypothetical protein KC678_02375 [Candidatus Dojkabacteria bacterium]|uniref:Uncharacterized protein n=1 Tax=Candidatus Dojkabacteria bacterium TaxID=2099670 RepID=A0A955I8W1_9BACT|nr:hypothetical protein [Candidatus Dojkabacteria bacterium]
MIRKIVTNKILITLTTIICVVFSFANLFRYNYYSNINLSYRNESFILDLQNGEYIELTSRRDVITSKDFEEIRPFEYIIEPDITLNVQGIDFGFLFPKNIETINEEQIVKTTEIKRTSVNKITYSSTIEILGDISELSTYQTQIDYSAATSLTRNSNSPFVSDGICSIVVTTNDKLNIVQDENSTSFVIITKLQQKFEINFSLEVKCK